MINSCQNEKSNNSVRQIVPTEKWESVLVNKLPYLGHRNWIVITDMAYPLQSGTGITTLYADEQYEEVLYKVKKMIDDAPHIFAHVYHDKELDFIPDSDVPGIGVLRNKLREICGNESVNIPHEELLSRLDVACKLFNVIIIKTSLTMPYTSTFFELDCNYWDASRQMKLNAAMKDE